MFTIGVKDLETAKKTAVWGTYGKNGYTHCAGHCPEHQYQEVRLIDCSTEHLQTLLTGVWLWGNQDYRVIVRAILKDRGL